MATATWAILLALGIQIFGALGPIYLKKASLRNGYNILGLLRSKEFWIGVFIYVFGIGVFTIALKGGDLSVLYPLVATVYIWVSLFSMYMLKEKMNAYKWTGVGLIIVGVSFIAFGL